ncbi:MAG: site-2 protease family protein [Candidatus Nanopelagicales bacterium]
MAAPTTRIAGIPVEIPFSGILGVVVLAYLWVPAFESDSGSPWLLALAFAVLLSLATLIHEFAHALVARALGFPVHRVVLQLLGGVTHYERRREAPLAEAVVAAAGPLATFAVAAVSWAVGQQLEPGSAGAALAAAMTWANVVIGIYNALPGIPLDGGNVLKCLIWAGTGSERRGTVIAAWSGRGLAALTLLSPLALAQWAGVRPDLIVYLVAGLLAAVLYTGATAQLRSVEVRARAANLTAGGLARRAIPVDHDLPLGEAIRRATAAGAGALVVVDSRGLPTGIGQQDAIAAVPEQRRPWISVGSVSRPIDAQSTISDDLAGTDLITEVARRGREELLVLDRAGLVFGVLLAGDVETALRG